MKNTSLPVMNTSYEPPARKVSSQNLADLLSSLELIINTRDVGIMGNDLIAIMTSMHSQLTTNLAINPSGTISLYKMLCKYVLDLIRGKRGDQGSFSTRQWDVNHNCPVVLIEFMSWYKTNCPTLGPTTDSNFWFCLQVAYAFFNGHRVIVTPMSVNLGTITNPLSVKSLPNFKDLWSHALGRLGITPAEFQRVYQSETAKAKYAIMTSGGPNGQATWSADLDAKAILASPTLFKHMSDFAKASGLDRFVADLVATVPTPLELNPGHRETVVTGRIHALEEWGGKTRLVAIMDYWTQTLLTPLHNTINYFVRRLEQDGTFNQDKIAKTVRGWTLSKDLSVNSFDLTAATDRIPIDIQVDMLAYLFGSTTIPGLWKSVLTDRDFYGPSGENIRYAVGQPMGAKSSFPMLALIHHALVQIAAIQANVKGYSKYVILGDDNTHGDAKVAEKYLAIMDSLGVEINLSKSVLAGGDLLPAGEICKRVFIVGEELTAIPVKALVKTVRKGHLAATLQSLITTRGNVVQTTDLPTFFAGLIDRRSLQALLMLNKVPKSVSGLPSSMDLSAITKLDYSNWFTNIILTDRDVEDAFLFALISEQLKRVDGLLRSTMLMSEVIKTMARPDPSKLWPNQLFESMKPEERATAIGKLPALNWSHPIVHASQTELERVTSHLAGLRSGTVAMQQKAKSGLLDLLRNNLSEIWLGEAEKSATVRRSIFNAMLNTLKRMDSVKVEEGKPRAIEFSIELVYVQRAWSVYWEFGERIRLNATKTKVSISKTVNRSKLDSVFEKVDIKDIRV